MPDGYELLSDFHRAVEQLFERFRASGDEALAREIGDELTLHDEIERQVLYPTLRRLVDGGDDLADEADGAHATVRSRIDRLRTARPGDLRAAVEELERAVTPHVRREEDEIFPAMRDSGVDAEDLGTKVEAARGESPSRSSNQVG